MTLKTLIVDDEPVARAVLREELECMPGVAVVGEAADGASALAAIAAARPDLVLLDLQMPGIDGFEVIRRLRHGAHMPVIVIVTAYDQYALEAFDAGAIDYLLKPVGRDRLLQAVERAGRVSGPDAVEQLARLQEIAELPAAGPRPRKIVGKAGAEYFLLNAAEICAFQAQGGLVWIATARGKYLATQTLKALQERLGPGFQRIHRNALVNVDHVRKMSALSSQRWLITLGNGQEFIASKRQARGIRRLLNC